MAGALASMLRNAGGTMTTVAPVSYTHLNGYSMTVQEDFVWGEGYGNGSKADDERRNMMIGGLKSLIHFADQR